MGVALPTETLRQFDRLAFVSRRSAQAGTGGEHVSRRPSPSSDFVDYRPYHPGDDFRRVDWNVYGRLGSLQVKVTEGRERLDVLLVLDCSSSMATDKLDFGAQIVLALGYIAAARADCVRITLLGQPSVSPWRPFGRRSAVSELTRALSAVVPAGALNLDGALATCVPGDAPAATLAVVVSDLLTPDGVSRALDQLGARVADVAVVHVVSPDDLEPRVTGEVELLDAETGDTLELGVSQATLAAYRARFAAWLDAREQECRRRGRRYVRVTADRPIADVVLTDLRRGGLLR
jgi:uncharacterized protein (DUF58 family)